MKISKYALKVIVALTLTGCGNSGFISNKAQREEVENQFENRKKMFGQQEAELFSITDKPDLKKKERDALKFLYAYMPINDIADYSGDFFLKMVRSSFEARDFFRWGDKVPEDLFRHFVLPPRVNNEDLDSARVVFLKELKGRIKNLSMYEAALEVNHWCHEKVAYRPSDSRTSSPLATVLSGYGRCGEESTFTVTALRAVGIPARQCYTPRWAHTDDNHAWVEVWCDGKWYYMGACEPECELNKAWFSAPVKRAMMVHTNVFASTKINILENYTDTKRLNVEVLDSDGKSVSDANVKYLLYNYSEFYPIYEKPTDNNGNSYVISGLGDLIVWSSKDGLYGYKKVSLATSDSVTICLNRKAGVEYAEDMEIVPPPEKIDQISSDTLLEKKNAIRLKQEDSIRNRYLTTFMGRDAARALAIKHGLDTAKVISLILKSEGNWRDISSFIKKNSSDVRTLQILSSLSDKDLRDTPLEILQSHLDNTPSYSESMGFDENVYIEGILSPHISLEKIRAWRPTLLSMFMQIFGNKPDGEDIKEWILKNIAIKDDLNYSRCPISPAGVLRTYLSDRVSRDICYVALCRTFGIPTRIDKASGSIEQYRGTNWTVVKLDSSEKQHKTGILVLSYDASSNQFPQYWSSYTIARMIDGEFISLDFENDSRVASFPITMELEEGYYRLCSGNRYTDGKVLVHCDYFNVVGGETVTKNLKIRELEVKRIVYCTLKGEEIKDDLYKNGGAIFCFIDPDKEPTKHLLNELPKFKKGFEKWNGKFVFAIPESKMSDSFNRNAYIGIPKNSIFVTKGVEDMINKILSASGLYFRDNFPLIFIVNNKGEVIFHSQGYKIGTADFLYKSLLAEYSYICSQSNTNQQHI